MGGLAEGHTDRHNMLLFLLQDTNREHPVGFEGRRRNIFDPEEDEMPPMDEFGTAPLPATATTPASETLPLSSKDQSAESSQDEDEDELEEPAMCVRHGCTKKPRFDSLFCSDSCGVSALESDLLRTFRYASDIHPSMLRN